MPSFSGLMFSMHLDILLRKCLPPGLRSPRPFPERPGQRCGPWNSETQRNTYGPLRRKRMERKKPSRKPKRGIREEMAHKWGVMTNRMLLPTLMTESAMTATLSKSMMIIPA